MNLENLLVENLNQNHWYDSTSDRNALFKTTTLSRPGGNTRFVRFPHVKYLLPDNTTNFILLSLGLVSPSTINLNNLGDGWIPLSTLKTKNIFTICFSVGRNFNLENGFISITDKNEVLIAIDYFLNAIVSALNTPIYIRFYSNIFYTTPNDINGEMLNYGSFNATTNNGLSYLAFKNQVTNSNKCLVYKNGLFLPYGFPSFDTLSVGDAIEYIYDPSIIDRYYIPIESLPVYASKADACNKLVVSIDLKNDDEFVADMEFFITGSNFNGQYVGLYFPRSSVAMIRQLTYKDFGLNASLLNTAITTLSNFSDVKSLTNVRLVVIRRDSGLNRKSLNSSSYIKDLMNLPANVRQQCLTGVNSTLLVWKAMNLETCPYNQFIQHKSTEYLSNSDYKNVYTRKEALAFLQGPIKQPDGNFKIPNMAINKALVVKFDANGKNPTTLDLNRSSGILEYVGNGNEFLLPFNENVQPLVTAIDPNNTYPVTLLGHYDVLCIYYNGKYTIATEGIDYTLTDNHVNDTTLLTWTSTIPMYSRWIISASNGFVFTKLFSRNDTIAGIDIYNGNDVPIPFNLKSLYVWLGGEFLIYGLDYVVFQNKIYMTSKRKSWANPSTLFVIYGGLPKNSLTFKDNTTFGFVKHGSILDNGLYDLIQYRDKILVIEGAIVDTSKIVTSEHYEDFINNNISSLTDGTPFALVDKPQFIRSSILDNFTNSSDYETNQDYQVSNFLSVIDPQPISNDLIVIPNQYTLVSNLMDRLIYDIVNGVLNGLNKSQYSVKEIYGFIEPYLWLLNVDLTQMDIDPNYVVFLPSWDTGPFGVSHYQYAFLSQVNSIILKGKVIGLSVYLTVS